MPCCPWEDPNSTYEPLDGIDAEEILCRFHLAEWSGTSMDGLDREDAAMRADMADMGYYD